MFIEAGRTFPLCQNIKVFQVMEDGMEIDVTKDCNNVWEELGWATLLKCDDQGHHYIDKRTGEVAKERVKGKFRVELKENASPAVRAIYEEMRNLKVEIIQNLPSWRAKNE